MVSKDEVRTIVGIIGNVVSFILFLSPMLTCAKIWKKRSVEQYSPATYLATLANCGLWVLYGVPKVHPHSTLVWTINGAGFILEFGYLSVYMIFSDKKKRIRVFLVMVIEIVLMAILAVLVLTVVQKRSVRHTIVGSICMAGNIMMYAAPLSVMKMVIQTKSVEYMPLIVSVATLGNAVLWTIYSTFRFDIFMTVPNSIGCVSGVAQILLYATFYKSTQRQIAERKAKLEVALSEKVGAGAGAGAGDSNRANSEP